MTEFWKRVVHRFPTACNRQQPFKTPELQHNLSICVAVCRACGLSINQSELKGLLDLRKRRSRWEALVFHFWKLPPLPVMIFHDIADKRRKFATLKRSLSLSPIVVQKGVLMDMLHAQKLHGTSSYIYQMNRSSWNVYNRRTL
jgi:hypothetical protein